MSRNRIVVLAFALIVIFGAAAAQAQVCGGTLSCTSNAYTFKSSGAGSALTAQSTYGGPNAGYGLFGEESAGTAGSAGVYGNDGSPCGTSSAGVPAAGVDGASASNDGVVGYTDLGAAGVA